MLRRTSLLVLAALLAMAVRADARVWTDSTGGYRVEADLLGFNDATVVLKKKNRQLVAVPIAKLSTADQDYLKTKEADEHSRKAADAMQTWTMASGMKVIGRVMDYGRRDVTIQRRHGAIYVNDRLFDNLPKVCQRMLPKIVSHFEKVPIDGRQGLEAWVKELRGEPRTYTCEGVLMQLENGDEYGVPFFFFSKEDLAVLKPGWARWSAADKDRAKQEHEAFLLQKQAQAYQQDRAHNQQIEMMQLQMQGYQAGLYDLWEVRLYPGRGVAKPPQVVVVPARNSRAAATEALRRNPGFVVGSVGKVDRKY